MKWTMVNKMEYVCEHKTSVCKQSWTRKRYKHEKGVLKDKRKHYTCTGITHHFACLSQAYS